MYTAEDKFQRKTNKGKVDSTEIKKNYNLA